jgi:hypothetical protein
MDPVAATETIPREKQGMGESRHVRAQKPMSGKGQWQTFSNQFKKGPLGISAATIPSAIR